MWFEDLKVSQIHNLIYAFASQRLVTQISLNCYSFLSSTVLSPFLSPVSPFLCLSLILTGSSTYINSTERTAALSSHQTCKPAKSVKNIYMHNYKYNYLYIYTFIEDLCLPHSVMCGKPERESHNSLLVRLHKHAKLCTLIPISVFMSLYSPHSYTALLPLAIVIRVFSCSIPIKKTCTLSHKQSTLVHSLIGTEL